MALNSKSKKHKMLGKKNLKTQYIYIYNFENKKNDKLMTKYDKRKQLFPCVGQEWVSRYYSHI